jgi:hypothetical protein
MQRGQLPEQMQPSLVPDANIFDEQHEQSQSRSKKNNGPSRIALKLCLRLALSVLFLRNLFQKQIEGCVQQTSKERT